MNGICCPPNQTALLNKNDIFQRLSGPSDGYLQVISQYGTRVIRISDHQVVKWDPDMTKEETEPQEWQSRLYFDRVHRGKDYQSIKRTSALYNRLRTCLIISQLQSTIFLDHSLEPLLRASMALD
ncbi:hypothetical protein N7467_006686 [Penicillium canescens]|nr:hypothetical protein N7467_006686 [Penicillium canescens]